MPARRGNGLAVPKPSLTGNGLWNCASWDGASLRSLGSWGLDWEQWSGLSTARSFPKSRPNRPFQLCEMAGLEAAVPAFPESEDFGMDRTLQHPVVSLVVFE